MWALPPTVTRRLVAMGDRVYVTMGYGAGCPNWMPPPARHCGSLRIPPPRTRSSCATAFSWRAFADPRWTAAPTAGCGREGKGKGKKAAAAPASRFPEATVVAIELSSGKTLWKKPAGRMIPLTLAAAKGTVCFLNADGLTALDLRSGEQRWKATVNPRPGNDTQIGERC